MFVSNHQKELQKRMDKIHHIITSLYPDVIVTEQKGFNAINYGLKPGMKHVSCYIIKYQDKANLGFPKGVLLQETHPELKGTGKTHRHIDITQDVIDHHENLIRLIQQAFSLS